MSSPILETFKDRGLWIANVETQFGVIEFLCGEGEEADPLQLAYLTAFLDGDYLEQIRKSAFTFPSFWHPIRFAVNSNDRIGVQFKNRFTGAQKGMFFADEHSDFTTLLSDM